MIFKSIFLNLVVLLIRALLSFWKPKDNWIFLKRVIIWGLNFPLVIFPFNCSLFYQNILSFSKQFRFVVRCESADLSLFRVSSLLFVAVSGVTGFASQIQEGEDVLISGWQVRSVSETGARCTLCSGRPILELTLIDNGLPQTTQHPFCLEPLWPRSVYRTTPLKQTKYTFKWYSQVFEWIKVIRLHFCQFGPQRI